MAKAAAKVERTPSVVRDVFRHTVFNIAGIAVFALILSISAAVTSLPLRPQPCQVSLTAFVTASVRWSAAQFLRSVVPAEIEEAWRTADAWEAEAWRDWEEGGEGGYEDLGGANGTETGGGMVTMDVPVLDLMSCHHFGGSSSPASLEAPRCHPTASDVANLFGSDFKSRPLLIKGLWDETTLSSPSRRLSIRGMANHADIANLTVPYYADASKSGYAALKPSGTAPLRDIVHNITTSGGKQKIGSQVLVETYPDLIEEVAPQRLVTELFGNHFRPDDVRGSGPLRLFPARTTVPVFMAGSRGDGGASADEECIRDLDASSTSTATCEGGDWRPTADHHPRTDLHCEPIGNVAVQLHGSKAWMLVPSSQSSYLRPSVSRHGRAFFYSNLDPLDPAALSSVPHYKVVTSAGDGLWVPPWMWHRVDYHSEGGGGPSLAASLFHFRPAEFVWNNPLFAMLIIPNLVKELLGRKTE